MLNRVRHNTIELRTREFFYRVEYPVGASAFSTWTNYSSLDSALECATSLVKSDIFCETRVIQVHSDGTEELLAHYSKHNV